MPPVHTLAAQGGRRVAVIGAGAGGLATGRILRDAGFEVSVLERAPAVGGVWRYEQPEASNPVLYRG